MEIEKFNIEGPLLIKGKRFHDERGFFSETYNERGFSELGLPQFVQDNLSRSKKGVFRGLHWQAPPHAQGKLVTCVSGSIVDFVLDIRKSSPTFGQHVAIPISEDALESVWVPEGFAHGFLTLVEDTLVSYKVSNFWNKTSERSLNPLDEIVSLSLTENFLYISDKDRGAPSWGECEDDFF